DQRGIRFSRKIGEAKPRIATNLLKNNVIVRRYETDVVLLYCLTEPSRHRAKTILVSGQGFFAFRIQVAAQVLNKITIMMARGRISLFCLFKLIEMINPDGQ